jgi:hypothetical protein
MANNKLKTRSKDTIKATADKTEELSYLEKKLGVTRKQIREAVRKVGNDRAKVEEYLWRYTPIGELLRRWCF